MLFWSGEGERKEASPFRSPVEGGGGGGYAIAPWTGSLRSVMRGGMEPCATWLGDLGFCSIDPAHGGVRAGIDARRREPAEQRRTTALACSGAETAHGWNGSPVPSVRIRRVSIPLRWGSVA
jgi:hypothetical protein